MTNPHNEQKIAAALARFRTAWRGDYRGGVQRTVVIDASDRDAIIAHIDAAHAIIAGDESAASKLADELWARAEKAELECVRATENAEIFAKSVDALAEQCEKAEARAEKAEAELLAETAKASSELAARLRAEGKLADATQMRERAERLAQENVDLAATLHERAEEAEAERLSMELTTVPLETAKQLEAERDEARKSLDKIKSKATTTIADLTVRLNNAEAYLAVAKRERDDARERAASAEQIADLARGVIRDCVAALGTPAFIAEDETHAKAPDEIRACVARLHLLLRTAADSLSGPHPILRTEIKAALADAARLDEDVASPALRDAAKALRGGAAIDPAGTLSWVVAEIRRVIGDPEGRMMLSDLPAAVEAKIAAAREDERAACEAEAQAAENDSDKANYPYDGGAGSLGYESACGDIARRIAARKVTP